MANYPINPYGQGGALPEGYPLSTSLDENNAQKGAASSLTYQLKRMIEAGSGVYEIIVAAANTPSDLKQNPNYQCDGTNDEVEINAAIAEALSTQKHVVLLPGDYYLDAPTRKYDANNDTFLLIDLSPKKSLIVKGIDGGNRAKIHISDSAYESLNSSTQYRLLGVYSSDTYGGYVGIANIEFIYPWNQKKICAIDCVNYGGWAKLDSIRANAYTSGYNGNTVTISTPPDKAVAGCIGIRFMGKGPNGTYASEIINTSISGFNEGVSINTEWTICNHVNTTFCVYGYIFGKYTSGGVHSQTHPTVLINCGDERNVNLPYFYGNSGMQDIEMIAFSIERNANNTPGKVLGNLAQERTPGSFRGRITYCTGQGNGNWVNVGFWEYGHGHGFVSVDTSHKPGGATADRSTYHRNYLQRYYDTDKNKDTICVDEANNVWKDTMGNIVSNS